MNERDKNGISLIKLITWGFFAIVLITILFGTFYIVDAGERAVLVTLGNPSDQVISEGLHFKIPLVQKAVKMDIKTQKDEVEASSASRDLQTVSAKVAVNYHLEETSAPTIYREVGLDYVNRILSPAIQESTKASTAQYTAEELITKRELVRETIRNLIQEKMQPRGIIVEDVLITNFDFSQSFNDAIESKVTAEQNALAAKNRLEQVKYEAEQQVTAAKGQAEAQSLLARSVTKDTLEYQALLNQKVAIDKWDGRLPQVTGGAMPFIGLSTTSSFGNSSI